MKTERRDDVLGGQRVFAGTRLSVLHVGKMAVRGVSMQDILDDYPYLSAGDVDEASRLYLEDVGESAPRYDGH